VAQRQRKREASIVVTFDAFAFIPSSRGYCVKAKEEDRISKTNKTMVDTMTTGNGDQLAAMFRQKAAFHKTWKPASTPSVSAWSRIRLFK